MKVLPRWGVSQEDLQQHFGGPAFLAWQRMGNIHSYAGPLPMSWIEDQAGAAVGPPLGWLHPPVRCCHVYHVSWIRCRTRQHVNRLADAASHADCCLTMKRWWRRAAAQDRGAHA
jgi:Alpha-N-acetylglucosaminidase (NAGLU) tim-barrel domain